MSGGGFSDAHLQVGQAGSALAALSKPACRSQMTWPSCSANTCSRTPPAERCLPAAEAQCMSARAINSNARPLTHLMLNSAARMRATAAASMWPRYLHPFGNCVALDARCCRALSTRGLVWVALTMPKNCRQACRAKLAPGNVVPAELGGVGLKGQRCLEALGYHVLLREAVRALSVERPLHDACVSDALSAHRCKQTDTRPVVSLT